MIDAGLAKPVFSRIEQRDQDMWAALMTSSSVDRRKFLIGTGLSALPIVPASAKRRPKRLDGTIAIPDDGWRLMIDEKARWRDDDVYLPQNVDLSVLPSPAPTGGWNTLAAGIPVTLPTTVEQHYWGKFGRRPYTPDEYRYADDDPVPQNGAYVGVSWWFRTITVPKAAKGKRVVLHVRGARLRAEVFLNEKLVGYSIMAELPFDCDLTQAMRPGGPNRLAIRITNPGGRYDWKDSGTVEWGKVRFYPGHGFGGLDRGLTITMHPMSAHIADAWVLNTPDPRVVTAFMEVVPAQMTAGDTVDALKAKAFASLSEAGRPVKADVAVETIETRTDRLLVRLRIAAPDAQLWDLHNPKLYRLKLGWAEDKADIDTKTVRFGFRWFSPEGIGTDAVLKLNGQRIKIYSAISWGYWGFNGLWPTPELAKREVASAKALGLNCLHFHRNVGKPEVFDRQDEEGLLRVMEPGAGRTAIGKKLKPGETRSLAEQFTRDYLVAKCVAMVKAFRSHPSLIQYTLQNEISGDLSNPDLEFVLRTMHELDPSRIVLLNDGFVARGAVQAMFLPYDDTFHSSDKEQWGGWWVNHQGAGDQWYDNFYADKENYIHRQTAKAQIVEFGEMEGCAVLDNHTLMAAEILRAGGKSYDLEDHKAIIAGYNTFLDRYGFRKAFPTAEALFLSIGKKSYDSWQNYLENIRIGDSVDMAAISGWESTAIENHSGIVDNLRNFRAAPSLLRSSLLPVRPVAKQRRLVYVTGETAELDLYLLNDTDKPIAGSLRLSVIGPDGRSVEVGTYALPAHIPGQFSYLVSEKVQTPAFTSEGMHQIRLELSGQPDVTFTRDIWVTQLKPAARDVRVAVSGIAKSLRARLSALPGVVVEDFAQGQHYDGIVASGLKEDEIARRQVGEQTGLEQRNGEKPKLILGELPPDVLEAIGKGMPLIAIVPEDGLADGVAKQLSALSLFQYGGQVGDLRAPWMGNWNFLRSHRLHAGIPSDMAMGVLHQVAGQPSNGLLVDGDGVEVLAGYSRDHDRRVGAASFIATKDKMRVLVHRLPDMVGPLQTRWLINAMSWLV